MAFDFKLCLRFETQKRFQRGNTAQKIFVTIIFLLQRFIEIFSSGFILAVRASFLIFRPTKFAADNYSFINRLSEAGLLCSDWKPAFALAVNLLQHLKLPAENFI